uniref:Helicase ATP-binding domain-containing protein n=1 Tax=viral metagenome TaxID=1070528 RepID=A0A6C0CFU5_9ZZZZ
MLTSRGYRIPKRDVPNLHHVKGVLNVKPYIPAVFVQPRFVTKYPVFTEDAEYLYVPKHYGIGEFGPITETKRDVPKTDPCFWEFAGTIRENQKEVVNSYMCPEPRDGIISLQTGGGKTVCALYIASQIQMPTIVLVHNTFLRDQWVDRIKSFLPKARIGMWNEDSTLDTFIQDFVIRIDGDVIKYRNDIHTPHYKLLKNMKDEEITTLSKIMNIPATLQSITSSIRKYTSHRDITIAMIQGVMRESVCPDQFNDIGLLIVDECHHIASEAFSRTMSKLTSKHMLGLSATPERKDKLMYVINWFLGPMLYRSNTADKVDEKVRVEVYDFDPQDEEYNAIIYNNQGVMFTTLMINKVAEYKPRNDLIVNLLDDLSQEDRQILVLTDRVEHTKTLFEGLPDKVKEHACILGSKVKATERAKFCESKKILIATYAMCKEGFDVSTLNTLVMATSRPDVDQIVGRIMRTEKTKRAVNPLIIDIVDPAFRRQFGERLRLYKERNYQVEKMTIE